MTPESLQRHGLTPGEYERIRELLGRAPNDTELGVFGVMWSEHCSYKSSRLLLKTLPTQGPAVLQGPGENAGIIDVGDGWACVFKIESHNHPSFVEPFQGAATGVGGILRDVFTMGARPVAVMDSLRFGPLDEVRNQSIAAGVIAGVGHYGNCFGVANLGGETQFDPSYSGNPLVNAFALGLARRDALFFGKASGVGNPVMYVGAKTGRDGIHGATMASEEFSASSSAKRPNVQVGDPFLEKLLLEACLEAMATGAVEGIQDMGAAGLTSSSCEMGARAGTGVEMDLDQVPQRESGMTAYEMLLSESQERMLLVAKAGREAEVAAVFRKWGLDAVTVGRVTPDGKLRVRHHGAVVAEIPNAALTDAAPRYQRPQRAPERTIPLEAPAALHHPRDLAADLLALLQAPNLASKTWVYEQYDTMVRTNTLLGPGGAAGVIRIKGTETALAMALAGNGRYCRLDPKLGAQHAVAEAARKVACTGAQPLAATNCLNFGNPEKPEVMWQLAQAIAGMGEACRALGTPITGGNVSLYNETLGEGIQPTPIVGVVGRLKLKGGQAPLPARFTRVGEHIFLLRPTLRPDARTGAEEFGSSEFAASRLGMIWGMPPALDLAAERCLHELLARAAHEEVIQMARPVGAGGRAVTLAKACLSHSIETGDLPVYGLKVDLPATGDLATALFGEFSTEVVVTSNTGSALQNLASEAGLEAVALGETRASGFALAVAGQSVLRLDLGTLAQAWQGGLTRYFSAEAVVA